MRELILDEARLVEGGAGSIVAVPGGLIDGGIASLTPRHFFSSDL